MVKLMKIKKSDTYIISSKPGLLKVFQVLEHYKIKNKLIINSKYKKQSNDLLIGNNQKLLKKLIETTTNLKNVAVLN